MGFLEVFFGLNLVTRHVSGIPMSRKGYQDISNCKFKVSLGIFGIPWSTQECPCDTNNFQVVLRVINLCVLGYHWGFLWYPWGSMGFLGGSIGYLRLFLEYQGVPWDIKSYPFLYFYGILGIPQGSMGFLGVSFGFHGVHMGVSEIQISPQGYQALYICIIRVSLEYS